ncbi:ankyrin-2-like [Trichogramma pretiosum]|uniref:ankyrin-2-like n=1 Tax=Trichogramma pretiosum TaxID=7493 RepID=UPI000C71C3B7|nr:ankyrin-2-like [Trichogramma pretiosum]
MPHSVTLAWKPLQDAALSGNLTLLESLLKGGNPDAVDELGRTALNSICLRTKLMKIDLKMIQLLIQYGADVNTGDEDGNSPMMNLFGKESNDMRVRIEALKILLKNGADVTRANHMGRTIFKKIILCDPTNPDTAVALELLLKNGADPNTIVVNEFDETVLHFICNLPKFTRVQLKMIQILLKYKADVNIKDQDGYTPIMGSFRRTEDYNSRLKVFKLLLENGADVTLVNNEGDTVLHNIYFYSVKNQNFIAIVELLLKSGVGVNIQNEYGYTALHIVVNYCRDMRRIELLLKNGDDPNIVHNNGGTPLHTICCRTELTEVHLEIIQLLIQYEAEVNIQDKNGRSSIINLFRDTKNYKLRFEIFKILLKNGADVTLVDHGGHTILHNIFFHNTEENTIVVEVIELLLNIGIDVNIENNDGETAFYVAVTHCKNIKAIELLLKNGVDPNRVDINKGWTALHSICSPHQLTRFHLKLIQLIIQYKANVNIRDKDGCTPIMNLFRNAENYKLRLEVCKLLLENGADVTLVNNEGDTVLHLLFKNNAEENPIILEAVKLFLERGVDVNSRNNDGYSALQLAVRFCRDIRVIELLLKHGVDPNIVDINCGWTALHFICHQHKLTRFHLIMIQLLIQYKTDVNIQNKDGCTPIMNLFSYAEDYKLRLKVCKLLLENGADVTLINNEGNTVLHLIFKNNAEKNPIIFEAVELLLKSGVDVNKQNEKGYSALHLAADHCEHVKIIDLLLKNGADPNALDKNGLTALSYICTKPNSADRDVTCTKLKEVHLKMIKLLIQYKADPYVKNHQNSSPIMYLFEGDFCIGDELSLRMKIFKLLVESGADFSNFDVFSKSMLLHRILRCDHWGYLSEQLVKGLEFLLKNGVDINMKDNNGETALHQAVRCTQTKHVAFLLKNGADPNITDVIGNIPLNYTFENFHRFLSDHLLSEQYLKKHLELLKLNVEHNADPSHVGGDGKTVLHSLMDEIRSLTLDSEEAADWKAVSKYVPQYVEILLKHGLDVNVKDGDGCTALNEAVSYCNYDVAKILVKHGADVNTVKFEGGFLEWEWMGYLSLLNFLAIIKLWQSKGFQINNHQYLTAFKFLTFHQDFEIHSGILDLLSNWIRQIYELGSGSLVRKSIEMLIRYDSLTCTNFDSAEIKKTLYTEINLYLYLIEYGNMYMDIKTHNYLRNKLNSLVSENPEIDEHDREFRDRECQFIRKEVDLAKKMIISNNISYLDLCTSSPDKTYRLLTKCDYESAISSAAFRKNFDGTGKIGGIIRGYITKALVRRFIRQSTTDSIKLLFHGILPDLCCDKIIKFLDVIDLVSVYEAVMNCES